MNVTLTHADLCRLVMGTQPPYEMMDGLQLMQLGEFTGGFAERWDWRGYSDNPHATNAPWLARTEAELWMLYQEIITRNKKSYQ